MKVIRTLVVALLASACAGDTAREPQSTSDDNTAASTGTAGRESGTAAPEVPRAADDTTATAPPRMSKTPDPSPARDAKAAAEGPVTQAAQRDGRNVPAAILEDFNKRIDAYVEVRERAEKDAPDLEETDEPARIQAAQDARGANIRALRANAKPGDVFTPEIRNTFRKLLAPELEGEEGRDVKQVLRDDAPAPGAVPLQVNAKYPEGETLPTVPAALLKNLPELPEGLEYRIIGKDLVLLDSDANLIVDYIRNAIR
jgi:hypothetical protein